MAYLRELHWREQKDHFDDAARRILIALSSDRYEWRSFTRLQQVTKLSSDALREALDSLMADSWVRASVSKSMEPIYGLTERVGHSPRRSVFK